MTHAICIAEPSVNIMIFLLPIPSLDILAFEITLEADTECVFIPISE
jgi:hypothetical protein